MEYNNLGSVVNAQKLYKLLGAKDAPISIYGYERSLCTHLQIVLNNFFPYFGINSIINE